MFRFRIAGMRETFFRGPRLLWLWGRDARATPSAAAGFNKQTPRNYRHWRNGVAGHEFGAAQPIHNLERLY